MNADIPEPWIETLLRRAAERGDFDGLPLSGMPIEDLDRPYEPEWWARRFIEREGAGDLSVLSGGSHLFVNHSSSPGSRVPDVGDSTEQEWV